MGKEFLFPPTTVHMPLEKSIIFFERYYFWWITSEMNFCLYWEGFSQALWDLILILGAKFWREEALFSYVFIDTEYEAWLTTTLMHCS